ncbi:MAG: GNAT family N-acetyltransferase [Thermoplasmata archaeon]|nr:GNAT family N-acetyltransferase [Thermoplasmata archaeon]
MVVKQLKSPLILLQRILRDSRIFYLRKELIYQIPVGDYCEGGPALSNADIRMATSEDIDGLTRNRGSDYVEAVTRRLLRGDLCFLLERNGKILSFVWASPEKMGMAEVNFTFICPPEEKSLAAYDGFTFPEHRGKGAYRSLFDGFFRYAKRKSYQRIYFSVTLENLVSRKVHEKLGSKEVVMELTRLILFGKDWTIVRRKWPMSHCFLDEGLRNEN